MHPTQRRIAIVECRREGIFGRQPMIDGNDDAPNRFDQLPAERFVLIRIPEDEAATMNPQDCGHRCSCRKRCIDAHQNIGSADCSTAYTTVVGSHAIVSGEGRSCRGRKVCYLIAARHEIGVTRLRAGWGMRLCQYSSEPSSQFAVHGGLVLFEVHGVDLRFLSTLGLRLAPTPAAAGRWAPLARILRSGIYSTIKRLYSSTTVGNQMPRKQAAEPRAGSELADAFELMMQQLLLLGHTLPDS